jgi:hypothetical protein
MAKARLAKVSVGDLKKEIARRQRKLPTLIAARDALNHQIAELGGLGSVKAVPKRAKRKPAKKRVRKDKGTARAGSLSSKLVEVFQGKKRLSITEAIQAVLAAGYKTKAKNFSSMVSDLLAKNKRFKRVGRGIYALKG